MNYSKHYSTKTTPQTEKIPGSTQVQNSAGGYSFPVDDWTRLDRFLILGTEGGSYYASEKKLTVENAEAVRRCIVQNGHRAVQRIVEISESGRAPKNDPAIFALAMAASFGDVPTRSAALTLMDCVCRTGTHLFQFAEAVQSMRGWGRGLRKAIADWYIGKDPKDLAYQVVKYQQRGGWSHRDLLRLSHPKVLPQSHHQEILKWVVKGWTGGDSLYHPFDSMRLIVALERAKKATSKGEIVSLIRENGLVRECIPTQYLTEPEVWEALLENMPLMAMIRNLATMTRVGLLTPFSNATRKVRDELNEERIRKAKVHPIAVLMALKTYAQGHGERGQNTWVPIPQVIQALDDAFYKAFQNVEPTGKRWYLGVDVSGSMWGGSVAGCVGLTPGIAAGAMALVTARTEQTWYMGAFNTEMVPFAPSANQRLDDFCHNISRLPWGGTNCALPMIHALKEKWPVDAFVIYTDSETWAGDIHPVQALREYREKMGIPAKLIVCGLVSNGFSIADPDDGGCLDVVGFDSATPQLIADFSRD